MINREILQICSHKFNVQKRKLEDSRAIHSHVFSRFFPRKYKPQKYSFFFINNKALNCWFTQNIFCTAPDSNIVHIHSAVISRWNVKEISHTSEWLSSPKTHLCTLSLIRILRLHHYLFTDEGRFDDTAFNIFWCVSKRQPWSRHQT